MSDDAVLAELQRLSGLIELAFKSRLDVARSQLRADKTDAAIFDLTARKWVAAGDLQAKVQAKTGTKPRATKNHVAALISTGLRKRKGNRPRVEYRYAELV